MNGLQPSPKALELEIADTLKRLRYQNTTLVNKRNLSAAAQKTQVGLAPFHVSGYGLAATDETMFAPLLTLESMGYGWKIGESVQTRLAYRYEPAEGEAIGAWLVPPECGVSFLAIKKPEN